MVPRQFSTRTLLALMGLVAVCLAAHRLHYAWYVRNYPSHYLDSLLYARVHNGDARGDVVGWLLLRLDKRNRAPPRHSAAPPLRGFH